MEKPDLTISTMTLCLDFVWYGVLNTRYMYIEDII